MRVHGMGTCNVRSDGIRFGKRRYAHPGNSP